MSPDDNDSPPFGKGAVRGDATKGLPTGEARERGIDAQPSLTGDKRATH